MNEKDKEKIKSGSNKKMKDPLLYEVFLDKYKTIQKLGEGSFGKVYKVDYNGECFALKLESNPGPKSLLEMENNMMTHLQGPNIPSIIEYGNNDDYNILVMQLMDKSLEDIFRIRKTFSIKTTAMIGFQLIGVLHYIHDKHVIHRDVKPDNCVMGREELNENLYLIDFGLAKKYRSSKTLKQNPLTKRKRLTGTARYASIHALEGYEQSRRDDMESVGYMMAYFLRGGLPWQGMKLKSKENKYINILDKKKEISSEQLFKGFPSEFAEILEYTKNLEYTEEPKYQMLRNKLMDLCKRLKYNFDYIFDWTTQRDLAKRKNRKLTSSRTQSTINRSLRKSSRNKNKKKYIERISEELLEKQRKKRDKSKDKKNKIENKKEKENKNEKGKSKENKKKKDDKNNDEKNINKNKSKEKQDKNNEKEDKENSERNNSNNAYHGGESNDEDHKELDSNNSEIKEENEENKRSDDNNEKDKDDSNKAEIEDYEEGLDQKKSSCCSMYVIFYL